MKIKKQTWVRTIVLILALINQLLIASGHHPLPFEEAAAYEGLSSILTTLAALWNWWKNNSFTQAALQADGVLERLKEKKDE